MTLKPFVGLVKTAAVAFAADRAPKMAAALAYYTAFAVAPLLLIATALAGLLFGDDAARGEVVRQLSGLLGADGARAIQEILERAWKPRESLVATALGALALVVAATGVFAELQDSLNRIWDVRKKPGRGVVGTLKDRLLSFSMVLGIGFLLLVSLLLSTALQALSAFVAGWAGKGLLIQAAGLLGSFALVVVLFGAMFRFLPDARTRWRDVWVGATVTAVLFTLGKFLIGLYLGRGTFGSTYGAAGSFVIFLLWVNYAAQIFFFGAEVTKAYAERFGKPPVPTADAVREACAVPSSRGRSSGRRRTSFRR